MSQRIDNAFIERFFSRNCSKAEMRLLNEYFQTANGRAHLDKFLKNAWKREKSGLSEEELHRHKEEFLERWNLVNHQKIIPLTPWKKILIAVSAALILATFGLRIYQFNQHHLEKVPADISLVSYSNPIQKISEIELPDGSKVVLGPNSELSYTKNFNQDSRIVFLKGEGFFDVKKDPEKVFVVHANNLQTSVLGTSFYMLSNVSGQTSISVSSGKVSIGRKAEDGRLIPIEILTAGKGLQITQLGKQEVQGVSFEFKPAEADNWRKGRLTFDSRPLSEITAVLESRYNKKIWFMDKTISDIPMSIQLESTDEWQDIMEVLRITLSLRYETRGNEIWIYSTNPK